MSADLHLTVYGTPAPQGSKRHVGRGVMVESSKAVKPWREAVKQAALAAHETQCGGTGVHYDRPTAVSIAITFNLTRPAGHYGKRGVLPSAPHHPGKRPDLDKLIRSTLDALGDAGCWADDSQVVVLIARKTWAEVAGAHITITTTQERPA